MKRIELNTGEMIRGFWDGGKFDFKMKSQIASYDYNIEEEHLVSEFKAALAFASKEGYSTDAVEIYLLGSNTRFHLFEKEDVERTIASTDKRKFLIYLETTRASLFICESGIRNLAIPQEEYPWAGDYKVFDKDDIVDGYLSAIQQFETHSEADRAVKLHIIPVSTQKE